MAWPSKIHLLSLDIKKKIKVMTNEKKKLLVDVINNNLKEADRLFKTKEQSDAFIIGWLRGALNVVKEELETK